MLRDGVEDPTFDAKAKDKQKSEAKDQLFEDKVWNGHGQVRRTQFF